VPVNVANCFGFNAEDSTDPLQSAFSSSYSSILVPNVGKPWITRPLFLNRSNQHILFQAGVEILAKRGEFHGLNDCLFTAKLVENVTLVGEKDSTFRMWKSDYQNSSIYKKSEWRHGLSLLGVKNVQVSGLTIEYTGGDGIYVDSDGASPPSSDRVTVSNTTLSYNHRQGMSVIAATNLYVENVVFEYTNGTPPMAGVDIEPDENYQLLENISFVDCISRGNSGNGFQIYLNSLQNAKYNISVLFNNCSVHGGESGGLLIAAMLYPGPGGDISFNDCTVTDTKGPAVQIEDKAAQGPTVSFSGCTYGPNTGSISTTTSPISLRSSRVPVFGTVHFLQCKVIDDVNRPYFDAQQVVGASVEDVTGSFHVVNPNGCRIALGHNYTGFKIKTESCTQEVAMSTKPKLSNIYSLTEV
jgi:hypothetical protein